VGAGGASTDNTRIGGEWGARSNALQVTWKSRPDTDNIIIIIEFLSSSPWSPLMLDDDIDAGRPVNISGLLLAPVPLEFS
jgi:hypothetical protein